MTRSVDVKQPTRCVIGTSGSVLPSVWKTIEEPTIGLSIRGCDEETSNIAKGVFTIVLGAVVFCDVLGVVGYSMAASTIEIMEGVYKSSFYNPAQVAGEDAILLILSG